MESMKKKYKEKDIVELMIKIYCDKNHGNKGQEKDENGLCPHCKELVDYAFERVERCPKGEEKGFCSSCEIHCYSKEHRAEIRKVMVFSGRRIIVSHPMMTIKHLLMEVSEKVKKLVKNKRN